MGTASRAHSKPAHGNQLSAAGGATVGAGVAVGAGASVGGTSDGAGVGGGGLSLSHAKIKTASSTATGNAASLLAVPVVRVALCDDLERSEDKL
jgi:hypothetical protein